MSDVFISYASSSRPVAARIAAAVEGLGFSVWWDSELLPHDQYGQMIESQLEAAGCVIVLWSEEARDSRWVLAEANRALDRRKLIQANLSERLPPLPFDQIQVVRLDDWNGEEDHAGWKRIAASVRHLASGEAPSQLGLLDNAQRAPPTPALSSIGPRPADFALPAAAIFGLAALPLIAARIMLSRAQDFLATPLTALAVVIVMLALLLYLPGRSTRLHSALIVAAIAGSLVAGVAHVVLAERFIISGPWTEHPLLLGCGVSPETCAALRGNGLSCAAPRQMCPLAGSDQPETVLMNYSYDPAELYGARGLARVHRWMQLAWNGLFLALAVLGSALLAPLVPARRR